jgi:multiple sugar transport system permease protein
LAVAAREKGSPRREHRREAAWGYGFVSIWVIGFLVFGIFPLGSAVFISMTNWNPIDGPFWQLNHTNQFIGFNNFNAMFHDPRFWHSIRNTVVYAVGSVAVTNAVALPLAVMLNQKIRGLAFFRTVFYLPAILPAVASTIILKLIFFPGTGALGWLLTQVHLQCDPNSATCYNIIDWFNDPNLTMPAVILFSAWAVGQPMIIYLAGLQGVDQSYYEAASIDGASARQTFLRITLPLITPTIFFNVVIGLIGAFQEFAKFLTFGGGSGFTGGPSDSLLTTLTYIWLNAFIFGNFGYASAMAFGLFALILIFTLLNFIGQKRWVFYQEERR